MSTVVTANVAFDGNEYNSIGLRGSDMYIQGGKVIIDSNVVITGNIIANYIFSNNNFELVTLAPNGNQNNYTTGVNPSRFVTSAINLKPVHSSKITGISTTGWEVGKVVTIRNDTTFSNTSSDGRLLIFEVNSPSSTVGNRFITADQHGLFPIFLMPQDEIKLLYDGSNLQAIGGSRQYGSTNGHGLFDYYNGQNEDTSRNSTGGGTWYSSSEPNYNLDRKKYMFNFEMVKLAGDAVNLARAGSTWPGRNCMLTYHRTYTYDWDSERTGNTTIRKVGLLSDWDDRNLTSNTQVYSICWTVHSANASNVWMTETCNGTTGITQTSTVLLANATTDDMPIVTGVFVNGDATQADFFYSTDDGLTFQFTGTNHTTNIPIIRDIRAGTEVSLGLQAMISHTVGSYPGYFFWGIGTWGHIGLND